ncbi:copper transporter [Intestinibacter bartlettii]|uniref:Copper transporter n=1 Tax=Intestinibacter bartlettii TaxID=261299 RepID=A0ABS6DTH7_9FIRM|nr:copper transporter [Intestinibacter bartlettii]MBU5335143.1 copper transporter [Intestinibacter bartlettii]MDO5010780.1 copper transporter [Intestinibacter bartlettii]
MNINMKYYIVTIGSIFLALGIGIIVGFNLNYDQELSKQQSEVLSEFEDRFDSLNQEKADLNTQIDRLTQEYDELLSYISQNYNILVADALTEKNTGIILTNEKNDYSEELESLIKDANGNLAFSIVLKDTIEDEKKLKELSSEIDTDIKTSQDCINYIVDSLNGENAKKALQQLQDLDLIEVKSLNDNYASYDSVVIVGENEDENMKNSFEVKEKNLISKLKAEKKYLVAVQREASNSQFINLCSDSNISTIDNIDSEIGKISLIMLIKDESIVGNYGMGENVTDLMPFSK